MGNNESKKQWVDEVLGSTDGMSRAQAPADLLERVMTKMAAPEQVKTIGIPVKQWVAAAAILLALNISSVVYFASRHSKAQVSNNANPLAAEMMTGSTYNY